jgi:steroid 5-alpha reductase family enzyme
VKKLPVEDTEIWRCWSCRTYHGYDVWCPTTIRYRYKRFKKRLWPKVDAVLDSTFKVFALLALGAFTVSLAVPVVDWLLHLIPR